MGCCCRRGIAATAHMTVRLGCACGRCDATDVVSVAVMCHELMWKVLEGYMITTFTTVL